MLSDKEKLEEELRFLKESFEIGVITEEEYEQGQKRIEKKMESLDTNNAQAEDISVKEIKHEDITSEKEELNKAVAEAKSDKETQEIKEEIDTTVDKIVEESKDSENDSQAKRDDSQQSVAKPEEKPKEDELEPIVVEKVKDKPKEEEEQHTEVSVQEDKKPEIAVVDIPDKKEAEEKENDVNGISNGNGSHTPSYQKHDEEDEGLGMGWIAVIAIVVLIGAFGFWFFSMSQSSDTTNNNDNVELEQPKATILCNSDTDCIEDGKEGTCLNPGTEESVCEYKTDVEVSLQIVSTECSTCDTSRVVSVIRQFFPNIKVEKIELDTAQGTDLVEELKLKAVPAYVLGPEAEEAQKFNEFSSSFNKANGNYVLKNTVANANYFVDRDEKPKTVELFIKPGEAVSDAARNNALEFLEAFGDDVQYIERTDRDPLAEDLGINTFPTFLVNNRMKFGGVQAADTIKDHYCSLNFLPQCSEELTKSLV